MVSDSSVRARPLPVSLGLIFYAAWAVVAFVGTGVNTSHNPTQSMLRGLLGITLIAHLGEAILVSRWVRRRGFPEQSRAWALSTIFWGVINAGRLRGLPRHR